MGVVSIVGGITGMVDSSTYFSPAKMRKMLGKKVGA